MSKKGVSSVSGNASPKVGDKEEYHIASWYPATPAQSKDLSKVTWELFKKRKNGTFTSTNIKKVGTNSFTFGATAQGNTFRLEAYLYQSEGGGLIITPQQGPVPKINNVVLNYVDDTPGSTFSFMEKLRAKANCTNMERQEVIFTLWEDDAAGGGHNSSNLLIDTQKARVGKNGQAVVDFALTKALMQKAKKGEKDDVKLEFYVTAEFYKSKREDSKNVDVANPLKSQGTTTPAKKPVIPKAKNSPAAKKAVSKKEEKGIVATVTSTLSELWDWGESVGTAIKDKLPTVQIPDGTTTTKVGTVDGPEKKEEKGVCVCKDYDLIWGNKVSCEFRKKVVEISKGLGLPQAKNEGANWLMAVMALETDRSFSPTCGTFKTHKDDKKNGYVGLIQFGKVAAIDLAVKRSELIKLSSIQQLDYVEKFFKQKKFDGKLKTKTDLYLAVNYPKACGHGTEKKYVVYNSTKAAYDDNPIFKKEKDEYWIDKKGEKQFYEGKEGSSYVWEFEEAINELYNEGVPEKVNFFGTCSIILNSITEKDVVTYNIYNDGKIEKSIPKVIKEGYEKKYKYVYHDKNKKAHSICILDWYNTKGKAVGVVHKNKPTHAEVLTDEKVSDGSTTRRIKYKNDDIAEYGKHPTKGLIWRLYKSTGNDIELIKMPDNLNYVRDGLVIKYSFSQTKRRYTGPNVFAGFVGALAECSYSEGIITTGSCFKEGSCFPSAEHVNGRSVDTIYYNNLKKDQAFVDAIINFKFTEVLVGNNKYCKQIKNAEDGGDLHNSHLHCGNFNNESIIKK